MQYKYTSYTQHKRASTTASWMLKRYALQELNRQKKKNTPTCATCTTRIVFWYFAFHCLTQREPTKTALVLVHEHYASFIVWAKKIKKKICITNANGTAKFSKKGSEARIQERSSPSSHLSPYIFTGATLWTGAISERPPFRPLCSLEAPQQDQISYNSTYICCNIAATFDWRIRF